MVANEREQMPGHRRSEVDMNEPSVSRVYDAYLGGAANNKADRSFAARIGDLIGNVQEIAVANRRFLTRGVSYAIGQGVDQVIDIGAGVPSIWHTHNAAHALNPDTRVVYVDHEAVAYEALRHATADDPRLGAVCADLRDRDAVLHDPITEELIDYSRPVVVVLGLVLHFIDDGQDPAGLLAEYREVLAPGSYLVISHDTGDGRDADMKQLAQLYTEMGMPVYLRGKAEMTALLDGFEIIEPGVVHMPLWHPNPDDPPFADVPERSCILAVVART